jgi:ATP-dependent Clp protease ATP-binding subunit ClpA
MARRHAYLTVEHLLYALIHDDDGARVLRHCGADLPKLKAALDRFFNESLDKHPAGEEGGETSQTLAFHRVMRSALHHAASAEKEEVEAGDLLAAIFQEPDSHAVALLRSQEVSRLDVLHYVSHGISKLPPGGEEEAAGAGATPEGGVLAEDGDPGRDPLQTFVTNLTERASAGALDPLIGRDREIDRTVHILARRRKNNPILVGETGVGKTAIAEGLAQRISDGGVPDELREAEIYALDLGALLAGTKYRGDFEARFKVLVAAILERPQPILFIDEIHTILGAGSAQGSTVDASSMLKPLLQSGELRCMGSTTYQEYRHFERDRALALRAAVDLSSRHLTDRFLPDKAIDVIDEVGAAVRLRRGAKRRSVGVRDVESLIARMTGAPLARAPASPSVPASSTWGTISAPSSSARTPQLRRWCARCSARGPVWAAPTGPPAPSSSSGPRASARPSWPSNWPPHWAFPSSAST